MDILKNYVSAEICSHWLQMPGLTVDYQKQF